MSHEPPSTSESATASHSSSIVPSVRRKWRRVRRIAVPAVLLVGLLAGAWAWERQTRESHWQVLLQEEATYEDLSKAKRYFRSLLVWLPNDSESIAGRYLAEIRLLNLTGPPDYRSRRIHQYLYESTRQIDGSSHWLPVRERIKALGFLSFETKNDIFYRDGIILGGSNFEHQSVLEWNEPPAASRAQEIAQRLDKLIQTAFVRPRDFSLLSQYRSRLKSNRLLEAPTFAQYRIEVLSTLSSNKEKPVQDLDRIRPGWHVDPFARQMIPDLVVWSIQDYDNVRTVELLDRIDRDWRLSAEARRAIPELISQTAEYPKARKRLEELDPQWNRSEVARQNLPLTIEKLIVIGLRWGGEWNLDPLKNLVETLDAIDPDWHDSLRATEAKRSVIRLFLDRTLFDSGQGLHVSTRPTAKRVQRIVELLKILGGPFDTKPLHAELGADSDDDAFEAWTVAVLASVDPEWCRTQAGRLIREEYARSLEDVGLPQEVLSARTFALEQFPRIVK